MKVICINAKQHRSNTLPQDLIEGKIYTAIGEVKTIYGDCYIIEELIQSDLSEYLSQVAGERFKYRFRIIDTDWVDEAIEKALNNEEELITI